MDTNAKNVFGQPRLRASLRDLRSPRKNYKSTIEDDLKKLIIMDNLGPEQDRDTGVRGCWPRDGLGGGQCSVMSPAFGGCWPCWGVQVSASCYSWTELGLKPLEKAPETLGLTSFSQSPRGKWSYPAVKSTGTMCRVGSHCQAGSLWEPRQPFTEHCGTHL